MSGAPIAKLVSSCSFVLFLAVCGWANNFREFAKALEGVNHIKQLDEVTSRFDELVADDNQLYEAIDAAYADEDIAKIKKLVTIRAASESASDKSALGQAKQIKANPLYQDPGVQEQSNWLAGALKRIMGLMPQQSPNQQIDLPQTSVPGWIVPGMWALLGVAVGIFGYFAIRHFNWKKALKRKAKQVLEDDEPQRTLDEWLSLADEHVANGRFREAVRAMYLSCLLKFDEAGIARFVRGETNWEHLSRITASVKRPAAIDFLAPTKAFDRIWYGFHVRGREDVEQFRSWYQQITTILRGSGK